MKILYAVQGTGNGHLCRAMEVLPALQRHAYVDVLISGTQSDIDLGYPVKYNLNGLSFIFGKRGGVDLYNTWKKNRLSTIVRELRNVPVTDYDLVINDFEPITAWACLFKKVPCISVSHQSALTFGKTPRPGHIDLLGAFVLRYYAPAFKKYGFHFEKYDERIFTPIIRQEIRNARIEQKSHYTVYLPAYSDQKIIGFLMEFPDIQWQVFSKHTNKNYMVANVQVNKPDSRKFVNSIAKSKGVICGAGFETPSEALYLGKKLLVIPMRAQYEQHFNAISLANMNVQVLKSLKRKYCRDIREWIDNEQQIPVNFPDETQQVVDNLIRNFISEQSSLVLPRWTAQLWQAGWATT